MLKKFIDAVRKVFDGRLDTELAQASEACGELPTVSDVAQQRQEARIIALAELERHLVQ